MKSYHDTLNSLFAILTQCNLADSDEAQSWQDGNDCSACFSHIRSAIFHIAGEAIIDHWARTGEIDFSLADRNPVSQEEIEAKERKLSELGNYLEFARADFEDRQDAFNGAYDELQRLKQRGN